MPEPANKPRRWFQIHLSTAILLMLAMSAALKILVPMAHWVWIYDIKKDKNAPGIDEAPRWFTSVGFLVVLTVIVFLLYGIVYASEWFIRRREARKP